MKQNPIDWIWRGPANFDVNWGPVLPQSTIPSVFRPLWNLKPGESGLIDPSAVALDPAGFPWVMADAAVLVDNLPSPLFSGLRVVVNAQGIVEMKVHVKKPAALTPGQSWTAVKIAP